MIEKQLYGTYLHASGFTRSLIAPSFSDAVTKKGAKNLVGNDFWLVVNDDRASCKT